MKRLYPLLLLVAIHFNNIVAQNSLSCSDLNPNEFSICEDFSDNEINNNPTWLGNTAQFVVNTNQVLQLQSEGSATEYLSTAATGSFNPNGETVWQFYFNLDFNPSGSNNLRVYLAADQADLTGDINGYFLSMGESGAADAIELRRQTGGSSSLIVRGLDSLVATMPALYLQVIRTSTGTWQIYTRTTVDEEWVLDAEGVDTEMLGSAYFGFLARHTSSNADAFFFDDILITGLVPDTEPPTVIGASALSSQFIRIEFSEALDQNSAEAINNYSINGEAPLTASLINPTIVNLNIATPLISGSTNILQINNVQDVAGNAVATTTLDVFYYVAQVNDIVITEIFPDPEPIVNLPPLEFVELYNRTDFPINLNTWLFTDATGGFAFDNVTIAPNDYLIICDEEAVGEFINWGNGQVFGTADFPSLNNSGDDLSLLFSDSTVINSVNYRSSWYREEEKDNGGWTLEIIDPDNPCAERENWRASNDPNGGTPGAVNSVDGVLEDATPPQVISTAVSPVVPSLVEVSFSERLEIATAENALNYTVFDANNNALGNPSMAVLENNNVVTLFLNFSLEQEQIYTLSVENIADCVGNLATGTIAFGIPQAAEVYDVLINEIYADPTVPEDLPRTAMPETERFVELYNRSNKVISLEGWQFQDATNSVTLPNRQILPNSYLVLAGDDIIEFAGKNINLLNLGTLPSPSSTGDDLYLLDVLGNYIHTVSYDNSWYRDGDKEQGGWTLELIDPDNPCGTDENWRASNDLSGGTPGQANSVLARGSVVDNKAPDLWRAEVISPTLVHLYFSEQLEVASVNDPTLYTIEPNIGQPESADLLIPNFNVVALRLTSPIEEQQVYQLTISTTENSIRDCVGNPIGLCNTAALAIPEKAEIGDIAINEILFNPVSGGFDFVELFNSSNKIVDISPWFVARDSEEQADSLDNLRRISKEQYSLYPNEYVVLTENARAVVHQYWSCTTTPNACAFPFIQMNDLPTFGDDMGTIAITDSVQEIILDQVAYQDDWHYTILDDLNGVSLERININLPAQDQNNWQSAAATVCFATPGYVNSQAFNDIETTSTITIDPKAFSPDGDSNNDFVNIAYTLEQPDFTANITIFDERGREVRRLIQNELLGRTGVFTWDGATDEGRKAGLGIYVIYIEIFDLTGKVEKFKETCVVGGKLK